MRVGEPSRRRRQLERAPSNELAILAGWEMIAQMGAPNGIRRDLRDTAEGAFDGNSRERMGENSGRQMEEATGLCWCFIMGENCRRTYLDNRLYIIFVTSFRP